MEDGERGEHNLFVRENRSPRNRTPKSIYEATCDSANPNDTITSFSSSSPVASVPSTSATSSPKPRPRSRSRNLIGEEGGVRRLRKQMSLRDNMNGGERCVVFFVLVVLSRYCIICVRLIRLYIFFLFLWFRRGGKKSLLRTVRPPFMWPSCVTDVPSFLAGLAIFPQRCRRRTKRKSRNRIHFSAVSRQVVQQQIILVDAFAVLACKSSLSFEDDDDDY